MERSGDGGAVVEAARRRDRRRQRRRAGRCRDEGREAAAAEVEAAMVGGARGDDVWRWEVGLRARIGRAHV